ncbi:hypothetical protein D3C85_479000 [compost metagenome]
MKISIKPQLSFTAKVKDLQAAIAKVLSITSFVDCLDTERQIGMLVSEGVAHIVGITPDAFACVRIATESSNKDGALMFDPVIVQGLIKGRDELNVTADKSNLILNAVKGKYSAMTEIVLFEESDTVRIKSVFESTKAKKLKSDVIQAIRTGIKAAELTNFYSDEVILSFVKISEKGVVIESADNFHISRYQDKTASKVSLRFAIPTKTFGLIDRFIGDTDAQFALDGQQLCVRGDGYVVSLPETQAEDGMFDVVGQYLSSLKNPKTILKFNPEAMKTVDNMFAITTEDTRMTFDVSTKGVKVNMTTKSGSVSDSFKAEVNGESRSVHIDPRIFNDLFKKVSGKEVPMEFFGGNKGTSSCFRIVSSLSKSARLTQIGTFYDE